MLLRASSDAVGNEVDLGDAVAGPDSVVDAGAELLAFAEASHRLDDQLATTRAALAEVVGQAGMVQAAMTAAVFRGLNITADASGIPIDDDWTGFAARTATELGTSQFASAANSPAVLSAATPT